MQSQARVLTLSQAVLPQTGILRDVLLVFAFSGFMALCAQIAIYLPFTPVPITGQTLGALLTGAVLGSKRGALAMLAYLAEGLAGLPVFAGGASAWSLSSIGVPAIVGPAAGFRFAFVVSAFVVGWLAERGWDRNFLTTAAAMFIGNVILYIPGLIWLGWMLKLSVGATLTAGLIPFIPGDLIKLVLAAVALPSAWALVQRTPRS